MFWSDLLYLDGLLGVQKTAPGPIVEKVNSTARYTFCFIFNNIQATISAF